MLPGYFLDLTFHMLLMVLQYLSYGDVILFSQKFQKRHLWVWEILGFYNVTTHCALAIIYSGFLGRRGNWGNSGVGCSFVKTKFVERTKIPYIPLFSMGIVLAWYMGWDNVVQEWIDVLILYRSI